MLKWLQTDTPVIIISERTDVNLRDDSGTFEADPSHYLLSTLNFSFLYDRKGLTVTFHALEGDVPIFIYDNNIFNYVSSHGMKSGIIYEVAIGKVATVKIRNLKNFDFVSYSFSFLDNKLLTVLDKGTSKENFWKTSYSSLENSFVTDFSPVEGQNYKYVVPQRLFLEYSGRTRRR